MRRVSTHCRTHKGANGIAVVTFDRVEYSAAADADWVASGRCRPANQRAARLWRARILAELRKLRDPLPNDEANGRTAPR
jgi:hypothetical protein